MHPQVALYHSKLLPKEAGIGAATPWHQDYAYWKTDENQPMMINCQLAIDPMTLENGCLEFIPGSHRWGLQDHEQHQETFGRFLPGRYYKRDEGVTIPMEPGDGIFFTALVIHGSAPNTSRHPRWANTFRLQRTRQRRASGPRNSALIVEAGDRLPAWRRILVYRRCTGICDFARLVMTNLPLPTVFYTIAYRLIRAEEPVVVIT